MCNRTMLPLCDHSISMNLSWVWLLMALRWLGFNIAENCCCHSGSAHFSLLRLPSCPPWAICIWAPAQPLECKRETEAWRDGLKMEFFLSLTTHRPGFWWLLWALAPCKPPFSVLGYSKWSFSYSSKILTWVGSQVVNRESTGNLTLYLAEAITRCLLSTWMNVIIK